MVKAPDLESRVILATRAGPLVAGLAMLCWCGCSGQSAGSGNFWPGLFHRAQPPQPIAASRQRPVKKADWDDADVEDQAPVARKAVATPAAKTAAQGPAPTVTSTMSGSSRQDAAAAISVVNQRLKVAGNSDPGKGATDEIKMVRKLRDDAQQAFDEQDYLTARGLAQKASVLAAQLPAPAGPPSR